MTPVRFIHTADWQLGLRAHFIPGDAGAVVRNARLETVQKIGTIAREFKADFVVVAGDVFEHHGLKPDTIRRSLDKMRDIPAQVLLLPGNHDPLTPEALYRTALWKKECPPNVRVLDSRAPMILREGVALLPCPLFERHELGDVTEHLTAEYGPQDHVRIGVAHGGIKEFLAALVDDEETIHNAIPKDLAGRARLDYLALGDWHGLLQIDERTWYSGTHEATRFKEQNPGSVLLVEVGGKGERPVVARQQVCTFHWKQHEFTVETEDELERLERFLDTYQGKDSTLIELTLKGAPRMELRSRLENDVLARARDRFRFLRVRDENLHTIFGDEDIAALRTSGWIGRVAERLQTGLPDKPTEDTERALRLLYRLHKEAS
ncbi:metallophosphoesterase family protein [Polyangium sorediatum]|uniref:DNA repair exonuclease n=1 Tax=Polyangium sorediatum TaxID=889274 RepID=A0ABT6P5C8_9BACT|nr:DNA repair exonuclease [Polyangium sorediatum]MDI1435817.1 DNA repair exonuclease [Polyangium sorediatum]